MDELTDPFLDTPYRTLGLLGTGGAARVYEVEHRAIGKRLVAKLLHTSLADDPGTVERMNREGKALVAAAHPNLVEVLDFAYTDEGVPYLVMERLVGCDLRQELARSGPLPVLDALRYAQQALSALETAHRAHIVHRDIKPENIFLHQLGTSRVVKVLDLGLAKDFRARQGDLAEDNEVVGTPSYMAPELIESGRVDPRTDIYAMGAVLYEMLAGIGPFEEHTTRARILHAQVRLEPTPLALRAKRRLPASLNRVVMKALAKDPARRQESAAEFEAALKRIESELMRALSPSLVLLSAGLCGTLTFLLLRAVLG
jgi:eukaryotic-like serine/threonine-protein kinase